MKRSAFDAHTLPRSAVVLLCACALLALTACGGSAGGLGAKGKAAPATVGPTGASFTQPESVTVPSIDDEGSYSAYIDISGVDDGYVFASANNASRLKFQVSKDGEAYNYDLPNDGTPIACPVNMGDGEYLFRIMQNTEGNSYVEIDSALVYVELSSEFAPFLVPNMFCDYDESSACVAKARELTADATNEAEAVSFICIYLTENITYDRAKAEKLANETGYVPDPDATLASGTGICFDYASLATAMLRSQGLPTKLITGYVEPDNFYHAWIMVYVDGQWKTAQFTIDPNTWSRLDITFAASGATQYTGSGTGYTDRYTY